MSTYYELSIAPEYVPTWGVVEAVREFFQNALDEETRDPDNKMFFNYDENSQVLRIGNKHGKLDAKTLLLGYTQKSSQDEMIGNHGEGYKIATVVLLRLNKQIVFYNYGCRQIWKPRFVKSRKYGTLVPTFFVDNKHVWESTPDNDLVIEISGITYEEYEKIKESNLHLVGDTYSKISTTYGDLLTEEKFKGKIFVGGLYICSDPEIAVGVDFHPNVVKLERDRTMVNSFDTHWCLSQMIAESNDVHLINSALDNEYGNYIRYSSIRDIGDEIARSFLDEHGQDAVPIADQKDSTFSLSVNNIIVSKAKRDIILDSDYYKQNHRDVISNDSLVSVQLLKFAAKIRHKLYGSEVDEMSEIVRRIQALENAMKEAE